MISEVEYGILRGAHEAISDITAEAQAIIDRKHEALVAALVENRQLRHDLEQLEMNAAGMRAQLLAFKAQHPDSPLFDLTGKTRVDGRPHQMVHDIYAEASDARGIELGVINPHQYREQTVEEIAAREIAVAEREAENDEFLSSLAPAQKKKRFFGLVG